MTQVLLLCLFVFCPVLGKKPLKIHCYIYQFASIPVVLKDKKVVKQAKNNQGIISKVFKGFFSNQGYSD